MRTKSLESSNFEASELVEVRSIEEILGTLDKSCKLGGIAFTRQMAEYCGRIFRISKKVNKVILESTGERRTLKMSTVMLEGAICNGKAHGGCDRSCFYLWPEAWLKKAPFGAGDRKKEPACDHGMQDIPELCQANFPDLKEATLPDERSVLRLRRHWWKFKRNLWHLAALGPSGFVLQTFFRERVQILGTNGNGTLNLQSGDYVEVRPLKEIFATLDRDDKLKGMRFNKEMAKFSGHRFKVYKRLDRMISEENGKLLKVRTPTVLLDGAFCDGKAHGECDRYCFAFWREAWLKKVPNHEQSTLG